MKYAKVVVDIKADFADRLYTYLAGDLKLEVGTAVKVPFGSKPSYTSGLGRQHK